MSSRFLLINENSYSHLHAERVLKYPKNICVLCLEPVEDRTEHACCAECDDFVNLLGGDEHFYGDAKAVMEQFLTKIDPSTDKTITIQMDDGKSPYVYVPNTFIFSNPEKHLYYACHIVALRRTYNAFRKQIPSNTAHLHASKSLFRQMKSVVKTTEATCQHITIALTVLKASYQVPHTRGKMCSFWLFEGGISASFFTKFENASNDAGVVYKITPSIGRNDCGDVVGFFQLTEVLGFGLIPNITNLIDDIPLYIQSADYKNKRAGRVIAYRNPHLDFDHPIDDPIWEKENQKRQEKLAKRTEQERKEQERKEKKEREREEHRQYLIKQREEETALRLARASLVEAVAKVDVELEQIRKLKELNREVALKNQKLADRKEAEKLAKEAEKRHAEKLKQKELERQKFISKKQ